MTATADSWEYPTQRKFDDVAPLSEVDPNDKAGGRSTTIAGHIAKPTKTHLRTELRYAHIKPSFDTCSNQLGDAQAEFINPQFLHTEASNYQNVFDRVFSAYLNATVLRSRALAVRESWINAMEGRIIQQELKKCYRAEGVNHYQNCRHLVDLYMNALKEKRVEGWRKAESA